MLAENIVLYLQNTHFVLLFNILCIEFHENFCEASLNYSQHAGRKKLRYFLLWKGEKSHWCKDWGWCKDRSMTVIEPKWVSSIWLMQSDIAKVQSDMYICFNANQPGINAMWPSVYMHSGNLELYNVTSVINAFQHHVKCHFDITTEYLLEYWAIYNKTLTWNPNEYLQLLHSFP